MLISHKHKFVYIAIPKTASSAIRTALGNYSEINSNHYNDEPPYRWHITALDLKKHFIENKWNWDEYFKFSTVRNPWDRMVSNYNFFSKYITLYEKNNKGKEDIYTMFIDILQKNPTFEDYIKNHLQKEESYEFWYKDETGTILLDFIGKVETLQHDFDSICKKIGISQQKIQCKNATKHEHYSKYYTNETKQIVAEKYANEIDYFNYRFEK